MALTDLETAQNKAALKVRRDAHTRRLKELIAATHSAEHAADVRAARKRFEETDAAAAAAVTARNNEVVRIEGRIAELQRQVEELRKSDEVRRLFEIRRVASNQWLALKSAHGDEVEARFPDLQGYARHSASAWNPPEEVLDAMEQARQAVAMEAV